MTADRARSHGDPSLFKTIEDAEAKVLKALRKFVSAIDDAFPHLSEDKPRRKALDSTFDMIERLVTIATGLAKNLVTVTKAESSNLAEQPPTPAKTVAAPTKAAKAKKSAGKAAKTTKVAKVMKSAKVAKTTKAAKVSKAKKASKRTR